MTGVRSADKPAIEILPNWRTNHVEWMEEIRIYLDQGFGDSLPAIASTRHTTHKHPLFVAAIALGAFLTFLIQPLAARSLLRREQAPGTIGKPS